MKTPSALNNRSAKAQQSFRIVECSGRPGLRAVRNTLPNIFALNEIDSRCRRKKAIESKRKNCAQEKTSRRRGGIKCCIQTTTIFFL
jgi:hypothetical protein